MRELRFAPFVRLEVDCEMPLEVVQRLTMELGLSDKDDVYTICGPMALGGEFEFFQMIKLTLLHTQKRLHATLSCGYIRAQ